MPLYSYCLYINKTMPVLKKISFIQFHKSKVNNSFIPMIICITLNIVGVPAFIKGLGLSFLNFLKKGSSEFSHENGGVGKIGGCSKKGVPLTNTN